MKYSRSLLFLILALAAAFASEVFAQHFSQQADNNTVATNLLSQPLLFQRNSGQVDESVEYFAKTPGGATYFFTKEEVTIALTKHSRGKEKTLAHSLKIRFVGANAQPTITAEDQAQSVTNYFRGKDPAKWIRHMPNYQKIRYANIYDGIDLVYYGNGKKLEYDFVVHPGADPNVIRIKYEGAEEALKLLEDGSVEIATSVGMMNEMKPVAYQTSPDCVGSYLAEKVGSRAPSQHGSIVAQWKLIGTNELQFSLGEYDHSRTLYIDPLLYSTYLGSNHEEVAMDIAVDGDGNAYIMGYTTSPNFPTTAGAYDTTFNATKEDVFISKLNASGTGLVFSTFLGGQDIIFWGSPTLFGASWGYTMGGIVLDQLGNVFVAGFTDAADFPTTPGAFMEFPPGPWDIFISKLSPSGDSLLFSTYLGGTGTDEIHGHGVAVDTSGDVYITGLTNSSDFPLTPGAFIDDPNYGSALRGFVAKFSSAGSLVYNTLLTGDSLFYQGGNYPGTDCAGIAVDRDGNAYVTGRTNHVDFPTTPNSYDTSWNGGNNSLFGDAFVTKLNASGSDLIFSTFLGGIKGEIGQAITLDRHRNVYITGSTNSNNYPTTFGAYDRSYNGSDDAFVTKLDSSGSFLVYSTFLGKGYHDNGADITVDTDGNALVFGMTACSDFPTTPGAYDVTFNGGNSDCFLTKFNAAGSLLLYSTFLGGSNDDKPTGLALDANGNAYMTGATLSSDFPTSAGAFDQTFNDSADVFVTKLSPFIPANVTIKKAIDYDGLMATDNDRQPKNWSLKLYSGSIAPGNLVASTTGDSMYVPDLTVGTYIAVEGDSSGWLPIGKVINNIPVASASHADTFTLGSGDARVITFINYQPRIVIRKLSDGDGNFATTRDRYLKPWHLSLYHDAIVPENLVAEVASAESLVVSGLSTDTYIAVESDVNGWNHIGTILDTVSTAGSQDTVTINYTAGEFHRVDFVNYGPNTIVVRSYSDMDGLFTTDGDRAEKKWNLILYRDSISTGTLVQSVASAESLHVSGLSSGVYIAVASDSGGWHAIGKVRNGTPISGSSSRDTLTVMGAQYRTVNFVLTRPTVTVCKLRDGDGSFTTTDDRAPTRWTMALYRGSISPPNLVTPSVTMPESLIYYDLTPGTYVAFESDSSGWRHIGTILDGVGTQNTAGVITFPVSSVESHRATFVNSALNTVTLRKFRDDDGDFTTTGDRTAKAWGMKLYRNSIAPQNIVDSVISSSILIVRNLSAGTYIALEADSGDRWQHIATVFDGSSSGGTQNSRTFTLAEGETHSIEFINFDRTRGKIWMTTEDCEWSNGDNWEPPGIPLPGDTIIVPPTAPCPLVIPPGTMVGTISVASQETIYVSSGTFVSSGDIVVNGTMFVDSTDTSTILICGNWQVNGFHAGRSTVVFVGITPQNIEGGGATFYNIRIGGAGCGSLSEAPPLDALVRGEGSATLPNVRTTGNFRVQQNLRLDVNLDAEGDTIEVLNTAPGAITGGGTITRGTIKRAIQQGATANYRFNDDQTYVRFSSTGTDPAAVTVTTIPDTLASLAGNDWEVVPSRVDTAANTVVADSLTHFSRWVYAIIRPRRIGEAAAVGEETDLQTEEYDTILVRRMSTIRSEGGAGWRARLSLRYEQSEVPPREPEDSLVLLRALLTDASVSMRRGWNIVSVPLIADDRRKTVLFPTASSRAFAYEGTYQAKDTLEEGRGYWLKFPAQQNVAFTGRPCITDSVSVVPGWNMIGSLSEALPCASITSDPPGLVTSEFYGYEGRYITATTITPGKGYWVKVRGGGELILSSSQAKSVPAASSRIRIVPILELPPAPPEADIEHRTSNIPREFSLSQNYPNPFNPTTNIQYALPVDARVTLTVHNILGQKIVTLIDDEAEDAGYKSVDWKADDLPSGVYFYQLNAGSFTSVKKMILMK